MNIMKLKRAFAYGVLIMGALVLAAVVFVVIDEVVERSSHISIGMWCQAGGMVVGIICSAALLSWAFNEVTNKKP